MTKRIRFARRVCRAVLVVLAVSGTLAVRAQTNVTLTATTSPTAAQPGITTVSVTGANFPSGTIAPSDVTLTIQPVSPGAGPTVTTAATAVQTVTGSTRRVTFTIPGSFSVAAPVPYRVTLAGRTTTGTAFVTANAASVTVNPPPSITALNPAAVQAPNTATISITTAYTNFVQGSTQANFGPGITVGTGAAGGYGFVTVTSPTTATAQISVAAGAAAGFRHVSVRTGIQEASIDNAFSVTAPTPTNRPPVANAGPAVSGAPGQVVQFDGRLSTDPDGDPLTFAWQFGDGQTGTGPTPTHTYAAAGQYAVTLTVDDGKGGQATAGTSAQITKPNTKPTARATGPGTATAGVAAAFRGADSSDPDGDAITFSWDFGDSTARSADANPSHTYAQAGTYTASLTVTDPSGASDTATVTTTVKAANRTPTANPGGPYNGQTGTAVSFDGSGSTDPDGDALTYSWDFGDNTPKGSGVKPTHTYASANTYVVTLTVTDPSNASNTASTSATIARTNHTPTANAGGPYSGQTGAVVTFDGSGSTDPDGDALTYSWDFGDNTPKGSGVKPTHTYTTANTYVVTLTVTDPSNASNAATASAAITTANHTPTANPGGPYNGQTGTAVPFDGSGSTDPDGDALTYSWNFGDGSAASTQIKPTHTYTTAGPYIVSLTVQDAQGAQATASTTAQISKPNGKPTARASGPPTGDAGATLAFRGVDSTDPDGDPLTYLWDFGDGTTRSAQPNPSHAFVQAGPYTVSLTVTDSFGASDTATVAVSITVPNHKPTAVPGGPYNGQSGATVGFDGSASSDPDGDALTYSWDFGDGSLKSAASKPSHSFAAGGTYVVTLTVTDTHGASDTATVAAAITGANQPPTANAGGPYNGEAGVAVPIDGSKSSDPDGTSLTYSWDFGDGSPKGAGVKPSHVYANTGTFAVSLTVTDPGGLTANASTTATVTASVDRVPPVVTLSGAKQALPGSQVVVTADAHDNIAVSSVTLTVNGADPVSYAVEPYQRTITVPDIAAPGSEIKVHALAKDPSNNEGTADHTITIVAVPDTSKPTVTLTVPPQAAAGSSILVTADPQDNVAVTGVDFSQNTTPIGSAAKAPYQVPYVIPADAPIGAVLTFIAQASDAAGNRAQATATLTVVGTGDVDASPPVVTVAAPTPSVSGTTIKLTSNASSTSGIASVTFSVDGAKVATAVTPPYEVPFQIATSIAAGTRLKVEARAVNGLALEAAATTNVDVVAPSEGVLTGAVFDDAIGLPVAGANVQLIGKDARGIAYTQTAVSDTRGQYVLHATEGDAIVSVSKPGWTRLDRQVTIEHAAALHVVDARLTNSGLVSSNIVAGVGGLLAGPGQPFLDVWQRDLLTLTDPYVTSLAATSPTVSLNIPAGTLAGDATLTLTPVSRQGLAGLLPVGWTPIAAADVAPHGTAFLGPAVLTVPLPMKLTAGTPLVLAQWDDAARAWRTAALTTPDPSGTSLSAALTSTGQFAWLLADTVPSPPPPATVGDLVPGVDAALIPTDATAIVDPQPRIIFYKPGVKSDVRGRVTSTVPLSSGTLARTRILESYDFFTGAHMQLDPTLEDVVLYQVPGTGGKTLVAGYPVAPSLTFEVLSLQKGVITVELRAPGAQQESVQLINETGGTAVASTGERIDVSAGAISGPLPVTITALTTPEVGVPAPDGFEIVGAVLLDFANTLAAPASLSVPRTAQVHDGDVVLVARMQELIGQTRFVTVGLGTVLSDRITSSTTLPGSAATFDGVRAPGRYVFLHATTPVAFSTGLVVGTDAAPFPGAVVSTTPTSALASTSQSTGRYIAAVPVGGSTLMARNPIMGDSASGAANATAPGQIVTVDFSLVAHFPTVTSVNPLNGAEGVPLSGPIVVTFSSPIDPATATSTSITLTSSGGAVAGRREISNGNTVVTFRSTDALSPNTVYTLTVTQAVTDPFGRALTAQFATSFTSLNTVAPPPPPAGSLSASIPVNGNTTVTVSQGAAGSKDTVVIRNVTRGTFTPISVVDPSVGFTVQVAAGITDVLQLVIKDRSGNETVVALPAFRNVNADGSISQAVSKSGGHIDGPAGIGVDVKADTFPDGAVVTVSSATEVDFPVPLMTDADRQNFKFSGGLKLDYGGKKPQSYLNVSIPTGPNDNEADRWIVVRQMPLLGETFYDLADTARVIDNRIATSSPPCPGVSAAAVYGFLKANRELSVLTGAGGVIRNPEALNDTYQLAAETGWVDAGIGIPVPARAVAGVEDALGELLLQSATFCVPVLSGKVTGVPNQMKVEIDPAAFVANDVKLVVKNTSPTHPGEPATFGRPFPASVSLEGGGADPVLVQAFDIDGVARTIDASLVHVSSRSFVAVTMPNVNGDYRSIVVENLTTHKQIAEAFARDVVGGVAQPVHVPAVKLLIEGTMTDTFDTYAVTSAGARVTLAASVAPYDTGGGNILFSGMRASIDPTPDEIDAYNATLQPDQRPVDRRGGAISATIDVLHKNAAGQYVKVDTVTLLDVDAGIDLIVDGGFQVTYSDAVDSAYTLTVLHFDGHEDVVNLPRFHVTVTSHKTKKTVRELLGPVPPKSDSVVINPYGPGAATPELQTSLASFNDVDPSEPITLTFSAPLEHLTASLVPKLFDAVHTQIPGTIVLESDVFNGIDSILHFIPKEPLPLGQTFKLSLSGVNNLLGHQVLPETIVITTFTPTVKGTWPEMNVDGTPLPFDDIQVLKNTDPTGNTHTTLLATSGNDSGFKLHAIDATAPGAPVELSQAGGGHRTRRLALQPTATFQLHAPLLTGACGFAHIQNQIFKGSLAMGTASNTDDSSLMFYDVTDPANVCSLSSKKITTNPAVSGDFQHGTFRQTNLGAGGGAFLQTTTGYAAYMTVRSVGLAAVDVTANVPDMPVLDFVHPELARHTEGLYPGDYTDVVAINGDRLLALNNNNGSGSTLDVFDANLSLIASVAVDEGDAGGGGTQAHQIAVASDVLVDKNNDGQFDDNEVFAFAYVAGKAGITVVDITDPDNPTPVTTFPVGLLARQVAASPDGKRLYVGGIAGGGQDGFFIVDVSNPFAAVAKRTIYLNFYPEVDRVQIDPDRPYVYVARPGAIDIIETEPPNLTGTLTYVRYAVDINITPTNTQSVFLNYNRAFRRPVRGAVVELRDQSGQVLGRTNTDKDGYYAFHAPPNAQLKVVVKPQLGPPLNPTVTVIDGLLVSPCVPEFPDCPLRPVSFDAVTKNVRVTQDHQIKSEWNQTYSTRDAGPFAILDTIYQAQKYVKAADPSLSLPTLTVDWSPSRIADPDKESFFDPSTDTINLKGQENVDTDEFDFGVILHEFGHYVMKAIAGRDDSLGGTHKIGDQLDIPTAFSEGFADAFAGLVLVEDPTFTNTKVCNGPTCTSDGHVYMTNTVGAQQAGASGPIQLDENDSNPGDTSETAAATLIFNAGKTLKFGFIDDTVASMSGSPAFMTIYSFLKFGRDKIHAMAPDPATADPLLEFLNQLATDQSIAAGDEWGATDDALHKNIPFNGSTTDETSGFFGAIGYPSACTPAGSTPNLAADLTNCKTLPNPDSPVLDAAGNKDGNWRFFKFTVPPPGACIRLYAEPHGAPGGSANFVTGTLVLRSIDGEVFWGADQVNTGTNLFYSKEGTYAIAVGSLARSPGIDPNTGRPFAGDVQFSIAVNTSTLCNSQQ